LQIRRGIVHLARGSAHIGGHILHAANRCRQSLAREAGIFESLLDRS
jgi:hypothetical protein